MSVRAFTVGVAALVWAVPAAAQQRGTMEFGGFGSAATFDNSLSLQTAYGGGGRVGMFLDPRLSIEFEDAEMRATRPNGLRDVNVGILSGRLVAVPIKSGGLSILLGAGGGVGTETNFLHTYGLDALVGAKIALGNNAAFRVDGVWDWLANYNWKTYRSVRVGISLYRNPARQIRTVTVTTAAPPPTVVYQDSVSAAEIRRLRERDAALQALRDSLNNAPARPGPFGAMPGAMQAVIHFAFDNANLTDSAKTVLDEQIERFRANPSMAVVILGYTDLIGGDEYNMALGERRAEAARAYLTAHGIDGSRVFIESKGEHDPITRAPGVLGQAPNRRAVFRLLIAPDTAGRR